MGSRLEIKDPLEHEAINRRKPLIDVNDDIRFESAFLRKNFHDFPMALKFCQRNKKYSNDIENLLK